ncbi:MAG: hypothetical protein GC192_22030 [Bacteroidetes bacterium]|nr:hypothetical protein [Bacteroidota bacterium]
MISTVVVGVSTVVETASKVVVSPSTTLEILSIALTQVSTTVAWPHPVFAACASVVIKPFSVVPPAGRTM